MQQMTRTATDRGDGRWGCVYSMELSGACSRKFRRTRDQILMASPAISSSALTRKSKTETEAVPQRRVVLMISRKAIGEKERSEWRGEFTPISFASGVFQTCRQEYGGSCLCSRRI